ncbi:MAG: cytochrome P460 family protein [Polyangiaceae bacterium]
MRAFRSIVLGSAVFVSAGAPLGCASEDSAEKPLCGGEPVCIAFKDQFAGYHSWKSTPGTSTIVKDAGIHSAGKRTVYVNAMPKAGSKEYPIGTIIVKEIEDDEDIRLRTVFAMVKRGGDFNKSGAANWEWFELVAYPNDTVQIKWRGFGPPDGENYGGSKDGCNTCHQAAKANDYVLTAGLRLP